VRRICALNSGFYQRNSLLISLPQRVSPDNIKSVEFGPIAPIRFHKKRPRIRIPDTRLSFCDSSWHSYFLPLPKIISQEERTIPPYACSETEYLIISGSEELVQFPLNLFISVDHRMFDQLSLDSNHLYIAQSPQILQRIFLNDKEIC